ncbi:structural maintenance of chromosomes protein 2 [Periplaneta americana]|uniref:structural maintenance of chromosomes protein 2 n=1 Tax=Periplaneta americana TaxID=6978 RepID=UPI0037E9C8AA
MYLKSIIIDGFKSYGHRTEINGFDREFNAITGLNGSGKSNILDAICFVLGITNLVQVRAGSLQELIYKGGQAGITKASVTLTFDNRNTSQSPLGYEQHEEITVTRQIVTGGKNKYLINGSNVQNNRVKDLFCSVQLNVNNPHFLIMQGRITKVLNMKPPEILAMIEEAAGTRMYECKKQQSQKTIEKKDAKLKELNAVINEEISPKLQKLQDERSQYLEYQKVQRELEHLNRLYVAWQYFSAQETSGKTKEKLDSVRQKIQDTKQKMKDGEEETKELDKRTGELIEKKTSEGGSKLEALEAELKKKEKADAQVTALQKANQSNVISEEKKKKQLEKSLREDEASLAAKEAELQKVQGLFQKLKDTDKMDAEALAAAQRKFQAVSAGLVTDGEGGDATLQDQLMAAKQEVAEAQTNVKQSQMQLQHCQKELKEKAQEMGQTATDYQKDKKNLEKMEKELGAMKNKLNSMNYQDGHIEQLKDERRQLGSEIRNLKDRVDTFEARYPHLTFRYRDPEPHFNRSSVMGMVCKVFKMRDETTATALEIAGGGKLFNVITDTEVTAKKLLQKGQLQRRTTLIPLNKISGRNLDPATVKLAQSLVGPENVKPALSLIEYDPVIHPVMCWVFGQTFICKDMDTAKRVTFHERILRKCVTLDGDVFDPSGTLSGGARAKGTALLLQLGDANKAQDVLSDREQRIASIDNEIRNLTNVAEGYKQLKQKVELMTHEVELVRQKLQQTTHHRHQEEVDALKATIAELQEKVKHCKEVEIAGNKKAKEIETKLKDAKSFREKALKAAEDEMKALKEKSEESREQWKQREQEFETLNLEIKELKTSIETGHTQLKAAEEAIVQLKEESVTLEKEVAEAKEAVQKMQAEVKAQKGTVNSLNKELQQIAHRKEKIIKDNGDAEIEIKKLEHEVSKIQSESKECQSKISALEGKYGWISDEKQYFGTPGGSYDFKEHNPSEVGKRLSKLQEKKDKLGRNINTRAMNLLGKEEEQYNDLMRKKRIVEADKAKIVAVIKELDLKKKEALRKAWEQVNKDFGSIFSTLLPGAQGCLRPPEGMDVLDGLEVKVGFGGIWKESLGELSGGQRSLVALSLILAMLLFKPAPIYILDEVDAALDLSHTQNIGNMLKSHFKHSQFIIVSLKDGMFNNANVLFRTKFVDGMSTVSRTVQTT